MIREAASGLHTSSNTDRSNEDGYQGREMAGELRRRAGHPRIRLRRPDEGAIARAERGGAPLHVLRRGAEDADYAAGAHDFRAERGGGRDPIAVASGMARHERRALSAAAKATRRALPSSGLYAAADSRHRLIRSRRDGPAGERGASCVVEQRGTPQPGDRLREPNLGRALRAAVPRRGRQALAQIVPISMRQESGYAPWKFLKRNHRNQ